MSVKPEPDCWRAFVAPHGGRVLLKPDLRLILGVGRRELHWFVEVDQGSEHAPVLSRKCRAYLDAWQEGGEQARAGVFPRVLWVVPDEARARRLTAVTGKLPAPEGMFVVTTTELAVPVLTDQEARR